LHSAHDCGMRLNKMTYGTGIPIESHAANMVHSLICRHPLGVTFNEFMHSHPNEIRSHVIVLSAIDLLLEQGRIYTLVKWRTPGYLQDVKLFCDTKRRMNLI
jgi:hypothetical protein